MNSRTYGLLVAAGALILDQGSKALLLYGCGFSAMAPGETVPVLPFFNLVMVWNPGITFGLFPANSLGGTIFLATFQLLAVCALSWWLWTARKPILTIGIGLVVGGAAGNLLDRLIYGKVADFFHFYAAGFDWYVFNVADTAITFGVLGLLYEALSNPDAAKVKAGKE